MDELRDRIGYQAFKAVGNYPAVADWGALAGAILAEIQRTHRIVPATEEGETVCVERGRWERVRERADWWCHEAWGQYPQFTDPLGECGLQPGDLDGEGVDHEST